MSKLIGGRTNGETGQYSFSQDISDYVDYAESSRARSRDMFHNQKTNYRSFAIIPDIVALDIFTKYGVDVNASDNGQEELQQIRKIIINNYPALLTGNIIKHPKGR